jgi:iron(III) transport system ATP-binding protein
VPLIELRDVTRRFGRTVAVAELSLAIEAGETLALLGPSGSGKTTVLRLLAGFDQPDAGRVVLDGRVVADAARRLSVPPEARGIGVVFQDLALFPHLSVRGNVAFGLRRLPADERARRLDEVVRLVGVELLLERFPDQLSGGQQQRVALARALAPSPRIVLLDEPFASLDAELRERMRDEVGRILRQAGATAVFVTHDQSEAFAVADRVALLNGGRLEQVDPPLRIYHAPATRFVADFVGQADFLPGVVSAGWLDTEAGRLANPGASDGATVEVMIRPDEVELVPDPAARSQVVARQFRGSDNYYTVRLPSGGLVHSVRPSTELIPLGLRVQPVLRPTNYVVFQGARSVASVCLAEECRCALATAHRARQPAVSGA